MTREDLIAKVAEDAKITKKAASFALNSVLDGITEALQAGEKITFVGFGTFNVIERKARKGINPTTKEPISIPACKAPVFKAGSKLKEAVK
ncbi:MAG TPA: HU family DNA-binding protein [Candidatus Cloacimonadota bacterium]|jgi:DNA-binding protein HU-beta|nr:HU family DNA-binding protein [Candidatus Cloacimonadota bacterium]HOD53793.1 HU family DNA-binding protein [Candidatus Cloacimonadota bacterium]